MATVRASTAICLSAALWIPPRLFAQRWLMPGKGLVGLFRLFSFTMTALVGCSGVASLLTTLEVSQNGSCPTGMTCD
jgi:hypothetical protein